MSCLIACMRSHIILMNRAPVPFSFSADQSSGQTHYLRNCEFEIFVPCAVNLLNLEDVQAVGCVSKAVAYFKFIQKLFNFFWFDRMFRCK